MKTVKLNLPNDKPKGKKIVMPSICCVCSQPATGFVHIKGVDFEGAFIDAVEPQNNVV